jgi:hypothetical protein
MARQTSKWLKQMTVAIAYAYAISSKTQKLSVQPNKWTQASREMLAHHS